MVDARRAALRYGGLLLANGRRRAPEERDQFGLAPGACFVKESVKVRTNSCQPDTERLGDLRRRLTVGQMLDNLTLGLK